MRVAAGLYGWRRLVNLLNLSTPLGLVIARAGRARLDRGPRGLILASGYRLRFPVAGAFTVGNVLVSRHDWRLLAAERPALFAHEERHTWQYLSCLGLPFLPAYVLAMVWSLLRHRNPFTANPFERWAGLADGGYRNPRL